MKVLFVYPRFSRHAQDHPELLDVVPMNEYLGSPSLGIAALAAVTPPEWTLEYRDDRVEPADRPTDADVVALSFFTPAATRALELARYFKGLGKTVIAGGIFTTMMPDEVQPHVDAVVVGEGDARWPSILEDARRGRLRPRYLGSGTVDVTQLPLPRLSIYLDHERDGFRPDDYPVQVSRGCGLNCNACVLPVSMTKNLRVFELDHVVGQLEQLADAGKRACLTEDTSWFPGSKGKKMLGRVLDYLAERPGNNVISYIGISMPMILATPASFFERAKAAGVNMFYLVGGFDPITTRAFRGDDPRALQKAHDAIAKSHDVGIEPYTSFLIGGDGDDRGTADRMLEFAQRAKIRKAEFAIFTPYPGTPSWRQLVEQDRIISTEWARYNDANVVFRPAQMEPDELTDAYLHLWREFYRSRAHLADLPLAERTIQF